VILLYGQRFVAPGLMGSNWLQPGLTGNISAKLCDSRAALAAWYWI